MQDDPEFASGVFATGRNEFRAGVRLASRAGFAKALELDSQLPLAEKYLIEANHARVMKDNKKAIEVLREAGASMPGDNDVQFALGNLYLDASEFDKARAQYAKVLKNDPKNLMARCRRVGWRCRMASRRRGSICSIAL